MSDAKLEAPVFGRFEVTRAKNAGNKPSPHGGELTKWYCGFKGAGHDFPDVYWQRKAGPDVVVGDSVYGKVEEGQHSLRFFKEPVPEGGGGRATGSTGSQNAGGKSGWQPESQRDPERAARILRRHSQGLAVRILDAMGHLDSKDGPTLHRWIKDWADFFDNDVNVAGEAARQASGIAAPRGQEGAATPPASAPPAPVSQPANPSYEEIEQALDTAGLTITPARQKVTEFMVTQLAPERVIKAVNNLVGSDLELQGTTLKALEENTETWSGGPLPTELAPGDEPPF